MSSLDEATRQGPRPLAIIPARKGSKRLKNKNKLWLKDKRLIQYTIEAALDCGIFEMIIVSSDDMDILEIAFDYFDTKLIQPHKRPKGLADDEVEIRQVVRFILSVYGTGEEFCVLQPTSPLRTAKDIIESYRMFKQHNANYLISVSKMSKANPFRYDNGAITWAKTEVFLKEFNMNFYGTKAIPFLLDTIDINTAEDFAKAEALLDEMQGLSNLAK